MVMGVGEGGVSQTGKEMKMEAIIVPLLVNNVVTSISLVTLLTLL